MHWLRIALVVLVSASLSDHVSAVDPAPGKYKLFVARGIDTDLAVCVLSLEQKDGGWAANLIGRNTALGKVTVGTAKVVDGFLRIDMNISDEDVVFEGAAGSDAKSVIGSCGNDRRLAIARLETTDEDLIVRERMRAPRDLPPPMREQAKLFAERIELRKLIDKSTTVSDRERLNEDLDRLQKTIDEESPKQMAKVLTDHAEHPAAAEAGVDLLNYSYQGEASAEQVKSWTEATLKAAARLGPRYRRDVLLLAVDSLGRNSKTQALAAEMAERADKELGDATAPTLQARILTILIAGLKNSGQADAAKAHEERLAKIDAKLDEDYRAKLPKIAVQPFGKRKEKANCVAFFELFIGAEGQSGAANAVAFDKLLEAFKPTEAVMLQYHLHVPAPDALANPESEARFDYYAKRYPNQTNVIPASFVNGRPRSPGGGNFALARTKFTEYCDGINPLVNDVTPVKLTAKATLIEGKIDMEFKVEGVPGDAKDRNMRLRMAVVEDVIRYPGGNGLRFYRHVVRAMPGGPDGKELVKDEATFKETVTIDDLRAKLNNSLNKIAANDRPFPHPYRPLELKNLKVAAWVQSDTDRAVWQAVMVDVAE